METTQGTTQPKKEGAFLQRLVKNLESAVQAEVGGLTGLIRWLMTWIGDKSLITSIIEGSSPLVWFTV